MRLFDAAVSVEARKLRAARVVQATTVFLVIGIAAIATGMTLAARSGNADVIAKLGPAASLPGWEGLIAVVLQITAAAAVLAFGVVLSWLIGREFDDGTITGLFALPVSRTTIVTAKLAVYLLWTLGVSMALLARRQRSRPAPRPRGPGNRRRPTADTAGHPHHPLRPRRHPGGLGGHHRPRRATRHRNNHRHHRRRPDHGRRRSRRMVPPVSTRPLGHRTRRRHSHPARPRHAHTGDLRPTDTARLEPAPTRPIGPA